MVDPNIIIIFVITLLYPIKTYRDCKLEKRGLDYFKVKSCHKSTLPIIMWKNVATVDECKNTARERNGLAFNFNPQGAKNYTTLFVSNCQVLGCPDFGNSSSLVMDLAYDYYSAYGNLNFLENYTCIKSIGLFGLTSNSQNYSQSILACQNMGGDLADITSEFRTILLSDLIRNNISEWSKAAYVGLDDLETEGIFRTSFGRPLICSDYRAWAPGHPRSKHKSENCVILDSQRLWRVINCNKVKLRGLCEMYPQIPEKEKNIPRNLTCDGHKGKNIIRKKKCHQLKELFQIYQNSSRADQCALINFDREI